MTYLRSLLIGVQARAHIRHLVRILYDRLRALTARSAILDSFKCPIIVPKECPPGPIFPLIVPGPKSRSLAAFIIERGFGVNALSAPVVPPGGERIRICIHAANTESELDGLALAVEDWLKQTTKKGMGDLVREKPRL